MNLKCLIFFGISSLYVLTGFIEADQINASIGSQEIINKIIDSEQMIRNVEVKMQCEYLESQHPLPSKINYEYNWGYEQGKEYYRGIVNALTASDLNKWVSQEVEVTFDGDKRYVFRHTIGDDYMGGAVRSLDPGSFRGIVTPNTLLGFDAQEHGRQTLGEALLSASESRIAAMEEVDGSACYLIEAIDIKSPIEDSSHNVRVWVDPERDYRPLKFERYRNYSKADPWKALARVVDNIKLEKVDGFWFPVEGVRSTYRVTQFLPPEGMDEEEFSQLSVPEVREMGRCVLRKSETVRKLLVDKDSVRINKEIPIERFRVQFPSGCKVWDEFLQMGYVVGHTSKTSDHMVDQLHKSNEPILESKETEIAAVSNKSIDTVSINSESVPTQINGDLENGVPSENKLQMGVLVFLILCFLTVIFVASKVIINKNKGE